MKSSNETTLDKDVLPYQLMEEEMVCLYHHLDAMLSHLPSRVIQFMAARKGEGASTMVNAFARTAADCFNRRILVLEFGSKPGSLSDNRLLENKVDLQDIFTLPSVETHRASGNVYLCPRSAVVSADSRVVSSEAIATFCEKLKKHFHMILIDALPLALSSEGIATGRLADGIILVVEAESTRKQVVEAARESLRRSGGNILGVVFNKRRQYIPDFIYNRL